MREPRLTIFNRMADITDSADGRRAEAPVRRLPLAAAPEAPALPDEVVYGFGRINVSGRVGDRAIVSILGFPDVGSPARRRRAHEPRGSRTTDQLPG